MYLALSVLLFALFTANVVAGSMRGTPFIGDVGEMLLLLGASIAFVAAIDRAERDARIAATTAPPPAPTGDTHDAT